ncbi:hypothetical protein C9I28_10440 [Pseudoduganella armeniaca]|uniref:Ice-binding protein C-terminal domain-containing protein n=1 Tax=Pseudoduganella armeniaca TaxID=2072590 RepID=A0A2R4C934_9BURK|nr:hypothetical protein C9I28_10440 [Pseudoduganella armeniaca]
MRVEPVHLRHSHWHAELRLSRHVLGRGPWGYFREHVITGQQYEVYASNGVAKWQWTPQTRFEISPPPVPEPATVWLLGAGITALGLAARRRRLSPARRRAA